MNSLPDDVQVLVANLGVLVERVAVGMDLVTQRKDGKVTKRAGPIRIYLIDGSVFQIPRGMAQVIKTNKKTRGGDNEVEQWLDDPQPGLSYHSLWHDGLGAAGLGEDTVSFCKSCHKKIRGSEIIFGTTSPLKQCEHWCKSCAEALHVIEFDLLARKNQSFFGFG